MAGGEQDKVLRVLREEYRLGCTALCDALDEQECFRFHRPSGGFFVWVRLPEGVTATALKPKAAERGVVFLPGGRCAVDKADAAVLDSYIRLCFAYEPVERLREGVKLLKTAVDDVLRGNTT